MPLTGTMLRNPHWLMSEQPTPKPPFVSPLCIKLVFALGCVEIIAGVALILFARGQTGWTLLSVGVGGIIFAESERQKESALRRSQLEFAATLLANEIEKAKPEPAKPRLSPAPYSAPRR